MADSQREDGAAPLRRRGRARQNGKLVDQFTEIESGKRSNRPKLAEALTACGLRNGDDLSRGLPNEGSGDTDC
jgi:hypothetical protein